METLEHTGTIVNLAGDIFKVIKKECVRSLGKGNICQNPETLTKFGNCLKGNLMPVLMGRVGELAPLVTEPMCQKEYKYVDSPSLWEIDIPKYLNMYASV